MRVLCMLMVVIFSFTGIRLMLGNSEALTFDGLMSLVESGSDGVYRMLDNLIAFMDENFSVTTLNFDKYHFDDYSPIYRDLHFDITDMGDFFTDLAYNIAQFFSFFGVFFRNFLTVCKMIIEVLSFLVGGVLMGFLRTVVWSYQAITFVLRLILWLCGVVEFA